MIDNIGNLMKWYLVIAISVTKKYLFNCFVLMISSFLSYEFEHLISKLVI